jgi:heat-inducible transcriptional repressor
MKGVKFDLDQRKAVILATIVYEYIATAEPVGSNTLTQKYSLGVSSATIRSEMAELESAGYLVQPHTSAGRVPSDAGYRLYVDHLMEPEPLGQEDQHRIVDELRAASRELDDVIEHTTRLLGRLSRNFAFAIAPPQHAASFRHIQLIWFSPRSGLAIVVTSMNAATQHFFELKDDVEPGDLTNLSNQLNAELGGRELGSIEREAIARIVRRCNLRDDVVVMVEAALRGAVRGEDAPAVTSSGAQNLLDQPEFHDLRKLRSILRIVEEQKTLYDLVAESVDRDEAAVKIGRELGSDDVSECSLVTVPYRAGDRAVGFLAILGPRRMPYGRLLALASGTAQSLNRYLAELP